MTTSCTKVLFISFNVICLFAGVAMFAGGLLIQFVEVAQNALKTINASITSTQVGAIGVGLIALGALVLLISLVGCCGAVSESRGLLGVYFVCLLLLFLGQLAIGIAALVYGYQSFAQKIEANFGYLVRGYGNTASEQAIVDFVQQHFECCGFSGTQDYQYYNPNAGTAAASATTMSPSNSTMLASNVTTATAPTMTVPASTSGPTGTDLTPAGNTMEMATGNTTQMTYNGTTGPTYLNGSWPVSCCKRVNGNYINTTACMDNRLPLSTLQNYLNTKGCTKSVEEFLQFNLIVIGGVAMGIAFIEIIAMVMACSIRKSID